nr:hypothetical protein [Tanacetum cinerariifolium]
MSSLFADTHNMVAILEKSDAAEGFKQIIDFLSGSYIHYALIVNPHIYISCIKQFWNTASVKRSDDVTRLQALVDRKKIMISQDVIHEILQLDDAESVVCLPNEEIFAGLAQMGYEKPDLSIKRSKVQFLKNQVGDLSTYTTRFISLSLTQKVFANMRRVGKAFSGVETPLFEGMLAARKLAEEGITEEQVQADDAAVQENVAEDLEIIKLKARVERLEKANKVKSSKLRCLRKVGASKRVESSDDIEDVLNQGRMIDDLDKDEGIELAEIYHLDLDHSSNVLIMQEDDSEVQEVVEVVTTAKLITDVVTAASQVSAASVTISAAKPSIPAAALTVVASLYKKEKRNDEDDDVFIDSTRFARKVPVVDYEIVLINNKPRFKIIKADETHQLCISFITLLKNFDREDLENLWRIVKERFSTSKPTNFSDEYLLLTLKIMFEKPDGQDAVWKNQRSVHSLALVKSWKLLTSCGVHIITLSTVQLILLVKRRYPLSRFILEQLVNVTRLQVEEESEMSLELLRFTRQQLQEYQQGRWLNTSSIKLRIKNEIKLVKQRRKLNV